MTTNFVNFSKYPWATQCLEMSKTTGHLWFGFDGTMIAKFIKAGDFSSALQDARSVGMWCDSVQGHDYWEEIYNDLF